MIVSEVEEIRIATTGAGDNGTWSRIEKPVRRDADATLARVRDRLHTLPRIVGERQGAGALVHLRERAGLDPATDAAGAICIRNEEIEGSACQDLHEIPSSSHHK
ncbi:MAG: hypothetical protein EBT83_00970 [Betaproteobacteria bacterium]|nr:hypothetical protein [Betaproteobacteria bacterium]